MPRARALILAGLAALACFVTWSLTQYSLKGSEQGLCEAMLVHGYSNGYSALGRPPTTDELCKMSQAFKKNYEKAVRMWHVRLWVTGIPGYYDLHLHFDNPQRDREHPLVFTPGMLGMKKF